ncbi:hypothetical protein D3C78_1912510 [compost metagenome]
MLILLVGLNDHGGKAVLGDAKWFVEIQRCGMLLEVADRLDTHWQNPLAKANRSLKVDGVLIRGALN